MYVIWLPRYYCDSVEAIRVESTGTEGDRSFTNRIMKVLKSSFRFQKNQKEKKRKQEVEEEEDENVEKKHDKVIWKTVLKIKQKRKENSLLG